MSYFSCPQRQEERERERRQFCDGMSGWIKKQHKARAIRRDRDLQQAVFFLVERNFNREFLWRLQSQTSRRQQQHVRVRRHFVCSIFDIYVYIHIYIVYCIYIYIHYTLYTIIYLYNFSYTFLHTFINFLTSYISKVSTTHTVSVCVRVSVFLFLKWKNCESLNLLY